MVINVKGVKFVCVIFLIVLLLIFTIIALEKNKGKESVPRGFMAERTFIYEEKLI